MEPEKGIIKVAIDNLMGEKSAQDYLGFAHVGNIFTVNGSVQLQNVFEYEFVNLGNIPVLINGVFLDKYYTGSIPGHSVTLFSGSFYRWKPSINAGERDTSNYSFVFQPTQVYGAVGVVEARLLVITKIGFQPQVPSQFVGR